jgi:hypothetical protein
MRKRSIIGIGVILGSVLLAGALLWNQKLEYSYTPPLDKIANPEQGETPGVTAMEAVDPATLQLGKQAMYEETFGNEIFFTDIMGLFEGPFNLRGITQAVLKLGGKGTKNLQVELTEDAVVGGRAFHKGELIDTGLDVAQGAYMPLGIKVTYSEGKARAGITCIACHAISEPATGKVLQGVTNTDVNVGVVLALATNSSAYFGHTDVKKLQDYIRDTARTVETSDGRKEALPDPVALEEAVDKDFMKWPKGMNDATIDTVNNPTKIPDIFTKGEHPYGWSGQGRVGPFHGLSAGINNPHAQNMDSVSQSVISGPVMGIDQEVYLGTILQNAANPQFRYNPKSGEKPSVFFNRVDPTPGVPGIVQMVPTPNFPKMSYGSTVGMFTSSPGYKAWEQINAMSAWMNTLALPESPVKPDAQTMATGQEVFRKAQCISCHAGPYFTNNRIIPAGEIGTEPTRAKSLAKSEQWFAETTKTYTQDTPVPLPPNPKTMDIEVSPEDLEQLRLGWAHANSGGGYKVPGLLGLYWHAPYLHDGGVAVGPKESTQLGIPGTLKAGVLPDAANSLRALVDRERRQQVMQANQADPSVSSAHITGAGHEYWADEQAGFTKAQQDALIQYLLSLSKPAAENGSQ